MSRVLKEFPAQRGRPRVYPWDEWMDGQTRELVQGVDYHSESLSFRVLAHRTAKDAGLRVRTQIVPIEPEGEGMLIQFIDG